MAELRGFVIVPPISPWDEKHRDEIELDNAMRTFGRTPAEAWRIHVRAGLDGIDNGEFSRRVQHWHDRGYRVREATLILDPA